MLNPLLCEGSGRHLHWHQAVQAPQEFGPASADGTQPYEPYQRSLVLPDEALLMGWLQHQLLSLVAGGSCGACPALLLGLEL